MKNLLPVVFALLTGLFWGVYGPALGLARSPEKLYSPFKPYVGVGLAYLVWAVAGGLLAMKFYSDSFSFSGNHSRALVWGFLAGSLGAFGALTLTMAMFKGGTAMPNLVMPIVFGTAVTVTAIVYIIVSVLKNQFEGVHPLLWVGMAAIFVGIILVAYYTPHPHPSARPSGEAQAAHTPTERQ